MAWKVRQDGKLVGASGSRRTSPTPWDAVDRRRFLKDSIVVASGAWAAAAVAGSILLQPARLAASVPLTANIAVDASHVRHAINPLVYGSFIEHIGRIIYGGIYEEGSKLSNAQGFRTDVLNAARDWGVTSLRWPGGNFASGYHWQDGIGPKENRPRRYDFAWFAEESNRFGTDEFIEYCRQVNAAPHICVNLATGTMEEAANWVEYCNGTGNTSYANLRRKYGHPEPYQVKYWSLGNEVWGEWQIGYMSAENYAKVALECGKMMKWVDPTIKLIACGLADPDWNRIVLSKLVHVADYVSIHGYEGTDDYYDLLGSVRRIERDIQLTIDMIDATDILRDKPVPYMGSIPSARNKKPIEIAFDEWNIMYRKQDFWRRDGTNPVEEIYNLRDALWVASVLNLFQRMGDKVTVANIAQLVNSIGTMFTNPGGMFLQTIYFPMKLYRQECGGLALRADVQSPTFSSQRFKDVAFLDVSATLEEAGKFMSLAVVNRHESQPITASVGIQNARVGGDGAIFEINGASPNTVNSFTEPDNVKIIQKALARISNKINYSFPPHSVTLLKLPLAHT